MSKFCQECYGTLLKNGDCPECDDIQVSKPKEKEKRKGDEFAPELEGVTWFPVKSPYKDYRKKQ